MTETKKRRGRPTSVDTEAAMQALVELFRDKGYAAVALDDVSEATGLSRPSLYRAFGNKLSMYIGAMNAFGDQVAERAVPALNASGDLESDLSGFYAAMLNIYFRDDAIAPGCLVFGTAPSSVEEQEVQERLQLGIARSDELFRHRILKSFPDCEPTLLSMTVGIAANTLIAFSARAKAGAPKAELVRMGSETAQAITTLLN